MTPPSACEPAVDEMYDANAEYYDAITRERVAQLDSVLASFADHVDRSGPPLLDIGAGTGRLTVRLARLVTPCDIIAIEPSRSLRAILASRVADDDELAAQVTIIPHTLDGAVEALPAEIGGAIAFGVLPHLGAAERRQLLHLIAGRVRLGGRALIEVMPPWSVDPVPLSPVADVTLGRHRVECFMQAQPVGSDQLRWTMTYRRTDQNGAVVHEAHADSVCWVTAPEAFEAEARTSGLEVEWPATDLALLSRVMPR